jgi:hypothetical protein
MRPRRPLLGPVDPFCWVFVGTVALVGAAAIAADVAMIGIALLGVGAAAAVFDSWTNRR